MIETAEVIETALNSRKSEDTGNSYSGKEEVILEKTTLTFIYCNQLAEKKLDCILSKAIIELPALMTSVQSK